MHPPQSHVQLTRKRFRDAETAKCQSDCIPDKADHLKRRHPGRVDTESLKQEAGEPDEQ